MQTVNLYLTTILLAVSTTISFCSQINQSLPKSKIMDPLGLGDSEHYAYPIQVEGLVLKEYRAGTSQREIQSTHAVFLQEKQLVQLRQPKLILYDQQGQIKSIFTSNESRINLHDKQVEFIGNVNVKVQNEIQLQTNYLNWNTEQKHFSTDNEFLIQIKNTHTIRGLGLDADENFEKIQVRRFTAKGD